MKMANLLSCLFLFNKVQYLVFDMVSLRCNSNFIKRYFANLVFDTGCTLCRFFDHSALFMLTMSAHN